MDFRLPELGEGVYEAEVVRWLVNPGDQVKRGQVLLEVLTDKATMEVPAPFAGTIENLVPQPGQQVKIGAVILAYQEKAGAPSAPLPSSSQEKSAGDGGLSSETRASPAAVGLSKSGNGPPHPGPAVKAAPAVRQLARKLGIDLDQVVGSGPEGRVLAEDLQKYLQPVGAMPQAEEQPPTEEKPTAKKKSQSPYGVPGTRIKLQGLHRLMAEHLAMAQKAIPHASYVDECNVTDLVKLRESLRASLAEKGIKLTYIPFFIKAVALALREVPLVNSTLDETAGEIVLHEQCNICVAVAAPGGLLVPVVRQAHELDLLALAREVHRLSKEARAGKGRLEDMRGGTFTITSIGNLGGLFATPIIHHPQVGILGIGKIVKRPVFDEQDRIRPAHMLYLSFTFDHRVLDGAVVTAFGNAVIHKLENPGLLLMGS